MPDVFYFGGSSRCLFGAFHEASAPVKKDLAAILCYPMGHEYIESHRAFQRLAAAISGRGVAALRFDYGGCGDSTGDTDVWSLRRWVDDVGAAIDEVGRRAAPGRIVLLGLRLGASIALSTAALRREVTAVALWDPVIDGAGLVDDLRRSHGGRTGERNAMLSGGQVEALGFHWNSSLLHELQGLDLLSIDGHSLERALIIDTSDPPLPVFDDLAAHLQAAGSRTRLRHMPVPALWEGNMDKILVPVEVTDILADWVCET